MFEKGITMTENAKTFIAEIHERSRDCLMVLDSWGKEEMSNDDIKVYLSELAHIIIRMSGAILQDHADKLREDQEKAVVIPFRSEAHESIRSRHKHLVSETT